MAIPFNLDHLNIKFMFDTLTVSVTQASHGIFKYACPMHQHSSSTYELHLVSGGKGTLILKDTALALNTGNLYMTGPGIAHGQQTDTNSPMEEYCIALDVKKKKKAKCLLWQSFFSRQRSGSVPIIAVIAFTCSKGWSRNLPIRKLVMPTMQNVSFRN